MFSAAVEDFNQKFGQSAELRRQISQVESLPQLMALLQEWGCNLTAPEIITLAQQAYQTWLASLAPTLQPFFVAAHENQDLNQAIETCHNPQDVIALADSHGFQLTEADLQAAATAAAQIEGFSFEKLWFKRLGL
jgi:predicted ribosomally synthesized peptide with nif11-like leader